MRWLSTSPPPTYVYAHHFIAHIKVLVGKSLGLSFSLKDDLETWLQRKNISQALFAVNTQIPIYPPPSHLSPLKVPNLMEHSPLPVYRLAEISSSVSSYLLRFSKISLVCDVAQWPKTMKLAIWTAPTNHWAKEPPWA